ENDLAVLDAKIKKLNERQATRSKALSTLATNSMRLLAKSEFADGGDTPFTTNNAPISVTVERGNLLQLIIDPRANYGADTTLIDLQIDEVGGESRHWNLAADVIQDFLAANPHADTNGN